jgi:hypothetical protein
MRRRCRAPLLQKSGTRENTVSDSEAVRTAMREAATRGRVRSSIVEEVRRLPADERDRDEMRIIREQMADLAPPAE